jgi:excisionase family DNA binding protein
MLDIAEPQESRSSWRPATALSNPRVWAIQRGEMGPILGLRHRQKYFPKNLEVPLMNVFTVYELSEMLQIAEKTLRKYLKSGKLKGAKIARNWLVHEDSLREFLNVNNNT